MDVKVGDVVLYAKYAGTEFKVDGKKLLILKPVSPEGKPEAGYVVAVDTVSAGYRETVLAVAGVSKEPKGLVDLFAA